MSLYLDCLLDSDQPPLRAEAEQRSWVTVGCKDADAAARAIAGTGPGEVGILLSGRQVAGLDAPQRSRAGLAVALCRLPPMPTLRLADVLLLGLRAPRPHLWQTMAGTSRARTMMRDDEAQVRALAGRLGAAEWLDAPAVDLPPEIEALADVTRAIGAVPQALVLRRPEWLAPDQLGHIEAAVRDEQQRDGFAVVELADHVPATPPGDR